MTQLIRRPTFPSLVNRDEFLTPFSSLFDEFFNESFPTLDVGFVGKTAYPKVDIIDEPHQVVINAEIPGLKKEQVSVELEKGVLRIKGEKKEEVEDKTKNYVHKELKHSSFCRSFTVGENVDTGSVGAKYENGILEVTLKKLQPTPKKDELKKIVIQ
jgi:HSP20 family protein